MFNNNRPSREPSSILNLLCGLFAFALGYRTGRNLNPRDRFVLDITFFMFNVIISYMLESQSVRYQQSHSLEIMSEIFKIIPLNYALGGFWKAINDFFVHRRHHQPQDEQNNNNENENENVEGDNIEQLWNEEGDCPKSLNPNT